MSQIIEIQQYVFGYDEGHRLIRGSGPLDQTILQELLPATDSPGGSPEFPQSCLIRGLPLKSAPTYALMCTWPAVHKGARPGTVWTQVLLIRFADLARDNFFSTLPHLFIRPQNIIDTKQYGITIVIEDTEKYPDSHQYLNITQGRKIVAQLYGRSRISSFSPISRGSGVNLLSPELSESVGSFMPTLLSIWSQQWPRLRRSFTFIVGDWNILNNSDNRRHLPDLIVTPIKYPEPPREDELEFEWIDILIEDMKTVAPTILRQFLRRAGVNTLSPRSAMKPLVKIYIQLRLLDKFWSEEEYSKTLSLLVKNIRRPKNSAWLWKQVVNPKNWTNSPNFNLSLFLKTLLYQVDLFIDEDLWEIIVRSALQIDSKTTINIAANTSFEDLPQSSVFTRLVIALAVRSDLLPFVKSDVWRESVVKRRPDVTTLISYWKIPTNIREHVIWTLDTLLSLKNFTPDWRGTMIQIIHVMPEGLPRRLIERLNLKAFFGLIDALAEAQPKNISKTWLNTLNNRPEDVIKWLETQINIDPAINHLEGTLSWLLIATNEGLLNTQFTCKIWDSVAKHMSNYSGDVRGGFATEYICCQITNGGGLIDKKFLSAFIECWKYVEFHGESYRQNRILDKNLPLPLYDWDDWDLCLRLELYLIKIKQDENYPSQVIIQRISAEKGMERLLRSLHDSNNP